MLSAMIHGAGKWTRPRQRKFLVMRLMSWIANRSGTLRAISAAVFLSLTSAAFAQFDPPSGYYTTATGTGSVLKSELHSIIAKDWFTAGSTNHHVTSYSNLPQAFAITDLDPNNSSNILLVYTGQSVSKVYDSQALPWNREHTWPDSRGINGTSP